MDFIGKKIGRYKIDELIGQGGMASVYKGYDTSLNREVAIKIIQTKFGSNDIFVKRFLREAQVLAKLSHPNIVPIYDFGEFEGSPYLVMHYMQGGTLKSRIETPISYLEAVNLLLPIAQALDHAHKRGLIHRDVKPGNIIFDEKGNPMLSDFGIARLIENYDTSITGTGIGIGTPEYMAPEQWQGKAAPQSDIYSLGVILFELITGHKPFTADTPAAIIIKQARDPIPSPRKYIRNIPPHLEKVILKALAKNIEKRYKSFDELISDLNPILNQPVLYSKKPSIKYKKPDQSIQKRRYKLILGITLMVIIVFYFLLGDQITNRIIRLKIEPSLFSYFITLIVSTLIVIIYFYIFKGHQKRVPGLKIESEPESFGLPANNNIREWQESGTMTVNVVAALNSNKQHNILQLIYREHELRLKDRLVHHKGGIRLVLQGFGRFGSTAILHQIIEQAKIDLANSQEKNEVNSILAVRIASLGSLGNNTEFSAIIRELRFEAIRGKYARFFKSKINKLFKMQNIEISESTTGNSFSIKAAPLPGIETSFSNNSGRSFKPNAIKITDSELFDAVTKILDQSERDPGLLERTINRLLNNTNIPARVIFIIENVTEENTLLALQRIRLFDDSRISIFAIVRQEDFLKWSLKGKNNIDRYGFRFNYVPCIWEEENHLIYKMLKEVFNIKKESEEIVEFINHIAYITKGAPGDVVREILDHKYITFSNGIPELALKEIRERDREIIQDNAIREKILSDNWKEILKQGVSGSEKYDQARIGIYEIIDWMYMRYQFALEDIILSAEQSRVPLSSSRFIRERTIKSLISVMKKHKLLTSLGNNIFRVKDLGKINSKNKIRRTYTDDETM